MSLRITNYADADFAAVAPLLREGTRGWGKAWRDEILRVYSKREGEAYLAEDGGRVIGTILLKRDVRVLVIYFLVVTKAGREKGVGSVLVKLA